MTYAYNILKSKDPKSKYAYPSREYVVGANIQAGMLKICLLYTSFKEKFEIINDNFNEIFARLFEGGQAKLELTDQSDILECGIDIIAQPPGKKLQNMMLLSGGEKAFTAIALVFAMLKLNPSPFCVFDEIDTSLDDNNVLKYCKYLNEHKSNTQFVLITHRKGTMENADTCLLYTSRAQISG